MSEETTKAIRYKMDLAEESLDAARLCLENGHLRSAVNRLYYGCFYEVSALLLSDGYQSSKHSGIRALFDMHCIKAGRLPISMGRFYRDLFKYRQEGDYQDFVNFERMEVEAWLFEARLFRECVEKEIVGSGSLTDEGP